MTSIFDEAADSSLFENRDVLDIDYVPDDLIEREDEIEFLKHNLLPAVKGWKPENILIVGKTGVGKTVSLKWIFEQLDRADTADDVAIVTQIFSCDQQASTEYNFLVQAVNRLRDLNDSDQPAVAGSGHRREQIAEMWYDELEELVEQRGADNVVLLHGLDELDNMAPDERTALLARLLRIHEHREIDSLMVGTVATANTRDALMQLDHAIESRFDPEVCSYSPYESDQLIKLAERRAQVAFTEEYVDESATQLAGALGANRGGNARTTLKLMRKAGDIAEAEGADRLTDTHVRRASTDESEERIESTVDAIGAEQKEVLAALVIIEESDKFELGPGPTFSEVYSQYVVLKPEYSEPKKRRTVRNYLNEIADTPIAETEEVTTDQSYKCYSTIEDSEMIIQYLNHLSDEDSEYHLPSDD
jgi:cell division control protein 6